LLLELALAERVDGVDRKVVVRDASPTGDPLIDAALLQITAGSKARGPGHWVAKFAKGTRQRTLDRLVSAGVLRQEKDEVLLVFPRSRYPAAHGARAPVETETRLLSRVGRSPFVRPGSCPAPA
jgi:hypothetical protein